MPTFIVRRSVELRLSPKTALEAIVSLRPQRDANFAVLVEKVDMNKAQGLEDIKFNEEMKEGPDADLEMQGEQHQVQEEEGLVSSKDDVVERAMDCIAEPKYKLELVGMNCKMETQEITTKQEDGASEMDSPQITHMDKIKICKKKYSKRGKVLNSGQTLVGRSARMNSGEAPMNASEKAELRARIRTLELNGSSDSGCVTRVTGNKPKALGSVNVKLDFGEMNDEELIEKIRECGMMEAGSVQGVVDKLRMPSPKEKGIGR